MFNFVTYSIGIMAKKKKHKHHKNVPSLIEVEKDYGFFEDFMEYGPQYDTLNDCPIIPGETMTVQCISFKKLASSTRKLLRSIMEDLVLSYWESERQIPFGGKLNKMREAAIREGYSLTGQYAKDSDDLKHLLNECVPTVINKELQKESDQQADKD